ncbi:MAG: DNA primase [Dehalococcoidia bacterium]
MALIEDIKGRVDILEFVGRYVPLQRAGRNYKALCPFHVERTPSFIVFPDRQSWRCFGACGAGGDVFSFVMRKENMEFGQALRYLAQETGVPLPESKEGDSDRHQRLRQANEEAAGFYHQALLESAAGGAARAYLDDRGLDETTMRQFQLGYSPDAWDALRHHLRQRRFSDEEMLAAGLAVEGERGPYDRFRQRLMFPIRDASGRVVGFGGRSLPGDGGVEAQPKYLNTPQTPTFDKGGLLYALDRAKEHIQQQGQAVIVEGYMDAIAAHQYGFGNVVASMGTALTRQQVNLLRRYTRNLALALDADPAGIEAALRILEGGEATLGTEAALVPTWTGVVRQLAVIGVEAKVIPLPADADPDRFIRADAEGWRQAVATATPMVDFVVDAVLSRTDRSSPTAKAAAVQRLLPLITRIADPVVQAHYVQRVATALSLREEVVVASVRQASARRRRAEDSDSGQQRAAMTSRGEPLEEYLLALMLRYPALRSQVAGYSEDLFWCSENRQVFTAWRQSVDEASLRRNLVPDLHPYLDRLWAKNVPPFDDQGAAAALADCLQRLERRQLALAKEANSTALAQGEEVVDVAQAVAIARAAWQSGQGVPAAADGVAATVASLYIRDTEVGLRLHRNPNAHGAGERQEQG